MQTDGPKEFLEGMLHPVRMRVLMAAAGSPGMTPLQIAQRLPDVPQASLYRHINRLVALGLLQLVEERPVRGTVEKVYTMSDLGYARLGKAELENLSKEEHLHFFTAFTLTLIEQFSQYLRHRPTPDLAADGVGYVQTPLFIADDEMPEFSRAIQAAVQPFLEPHAGPEDGPERKKRVFTTVMIPDVSGE